MSKINLEYMPGPNREYSMAFPSLAGGLNLKDLNYMLSSDESPDMRNLFWKDGCLNCRDGQVWLDSTERGAGHAISEHMFHDALIYHAGTSLYAAVDDEVTTLCTDANMTKRGTFFLYDACLYYKAPGVYKKIEHSASGFTVADVVGYIPTTYINCSPENGSGNEFEYENRISSKKTLWYNAESGVTEYHLPVNATSVGPIYVDGVEMTEGTDYSYSNGVVTFETAPPVTTPPTNNTVKMTYTLDNPVAMANIMDCPYAITYGGTGSMCVVMGGSKTQPNAYFWNGVGDTVMSAAYFPMPHYQLAGDSSESITGFGLQQYYLIILKENSIGRSKLETEEISVVGSDVPRVVLSLPFTMINGRAGCDLPWTIKLIENNLVWCNTEQGVHRLKDSSAAYESNLVCISQKVNASTTKYGLLQDVRTADKESVCCCNDTRRYWVVANGKAWVWDYSISEYKDPSWFYYTNINAVDFSTEEETVYHLDGKGRLTVFKRVFSDYDEAIEKRYRFATQIFGSYDSLKNVNSILIATRSDTNSTVELTYITDYETRKDLTDLRNWHWVLIPRDLSKRSLAGSAFAEVFRRKPFCRRVKHFTMQLDNNAVGDDLSVCSAQIFYNYQGRERGRQIR